MASVCALDLAVVSNPQFTPSSDFSPATEVDFDQALLKWDPDVRKAARFAAMKFGLDESHADDFAQMARIKLFNVLRRQSAVPAPYIRRVISNAVQSGVSATRLSSRHLPFDDVTEELEGGVENSASDTDSLMVLGVKQFVASLPAKLRTLYGLLYVKGHTQQEAASLLGVAQPRIAQLHQELLQCGRHYFECCGDKAGAPKELCLVDATTLETPLSKAA